MPFVKGQSGNPQGRPRSGQALTDIIRKELSKKNTAGIPKKKAVALKLIDLALEGDVAALRYLIDRLDGKPKETVDNNLSGGLVIGDVEMIDKKLWERLNASDSGKN
jgi:hypothetical protein